jgi:kinase
VTLRERGPTAIHDRRPRSDHGSDRFPGDPEITFLTCRTHKRIAAELSDEKSSWALTSFHKVDFSERDIVSSLHENNVVGQGSTSKVYKAVVGPHGEAMAVKKLWANSDASSRNGFFEAEVETLSKVRHKNIAKLACCITNRACRLLVYEYMPNGSLGC